MKRLLIAVSAVLLSLAVPAQETDLPKFSTTVRLIVRGEEDLQPRIKSYIGRELRALGDVEVVDATADWHIRIVALEGRYVSGKKAGDTVLSLVIARMQAEWLSWRLPVFGSDFHSDGTYEAASPRIKDLILNANTFEDMLRPWLPHLCVIASQKVLTCETDELKEVCESIVIEFDTDVLQFERKTHRTSQEIVKKHPKPATQSQDKPRKSP